MMEMDSKTALRGVNASAGPFATLTNNAARSRACSIRPLSFTVVVNVNTDHGINQNDKAYSETPLRPDHRQMRIRERPPKVAGYPIPAVSGLRLIEDPRIALSGVGINAATGSFALRPYGAPIYASS